MATINNFWIFFFPLSFYNSFQGSRISSNKEKCNVSIGIYIGARGFPDGSEGKESALQCGRHGFDLWVKKIPWRRECQPTPISWPGESHGQRLQSMESQRVRHD